MTAYEITFAAVLLTTLVLLLAVAHRQLQRIAFDEHVDAAIAIGNGSDQ